MDDYVDETMFELDRFAIGQPVPRSEDPVLLRGEGHYADDVSLPGQAYAVMVRSAYAHGVIRHIDTAAARAMPGVLAIYTAADLAAAGIGPLAPRQVMKNRDGTPMLSPVRHALATDRVRYVGEAVAAVVAETLAQAKDAAEAMHRRDRAGCRRSPRPALAAAAGAPLLYDEVPGNVGLDFHFGDSDKVAAAFAAAAHVTQLQSAQQPHRRQRDGAALRRSRNTTPSGSIGRSMSAARGCSGFATTSPSVLGVGRDKVRVLTDRVGGSFGMKQATYAEYYCILQAARELGRPVKWTDERSGSFVSDSHGRDHEMTAELALDRDGNFLAVRLTGFGNLGATYGAPGPGDQQRGAQHARRLHARR